MARRIEISVVFEARYQVRVSKGLVPITARAWARGSLAEPFQNIPNPDIAKAQISRELPAFFH
jgi:hypothetical protein